MTQKQANGIADTPGLASNQGHDRMERKSISFVSAFQHAALEIRSFPAQLERMVDELQWVDTPEPPRTSETIWTV